MIDERTDEQLLFVSDDLWLPLTDGPTMTSAVELDDLTIAAGATFDYEFTGATSFVPAQPPTQLPTEFGLGVIVGASGSGKSTMLRSFGAVDDHPWQRGRSIASHFASADEARERFAAVGLNSVPTWGKPYDVLSNGERFRADLARSLEDGAVIDEFTSVVDRNVAISVSKAIRRYVDQSGRRNVVLATCHRDVLPWLQPDWIIDLDIRSWARLPRGCLQRPDLVVEVYPASNAAWQLFARHHYLNANLIESARCFIAVMNDELVGFASASPFPTGQINNAWREHRTVILPDFQGLGLGVRLSDFIGQAMLDEGKRYYSKTAHPRMIGYRMQSPLWRHIDIDWSLRYDEKGMAPTYKTVRHVGTSFEYVGLRGVVHHDKRVWKPKTMDLWNDWEGAQF